MHLTFWDHVGELRTVLIRSGITILVGFVISLFFYDKLFTVLTAPLKTSTFFEQTIQRKRFVNNSTGPQEIALGDKRLVNFSQGVRISDENSLELSPGAYVDLDIPTAAKSLVVLSPLEGMLVAFKVSFWMGIVLSSPCWLYFLLDFVLPALSDTEKSLVLPFLFFSYLFVTMGILFAYYITIPFANQYLNAFNSVFAENIWSLSSYISYTLFLMVSSGVAFELGVILFLLVHFRIISAEAMRKKRKYMIVAAFILGALLTPPDVLTQLMMAVPLIIMYELAILYASFRSVRNKECYDR
jgi:sec-independent protein translocase protein TatC